MINNKVMLMVGPNKNQRKSFNSNVMKISVYSITLLIICIFILGLQQEKFLKRVCLCVLIQNFYTKTLINPIS